MEDEVLNAITSNRVPITLSQISKRFPGFEHQQIETVLSVLLSSAKIERGEIALDEKSAVLVYFPSPKERFRHTKSQIEQMEKELVLLEEEEKEYEAAKERIQLLHKYNEAKDVGQELMGKLAQIENTNIKCIYERYNMDLSD